MISKKDIHLFEDKPRMLLQASEFICLVPHPKLREYISNYNITFPTKALMPNGFTVMPSGCSTITVVNDGKKLLFDLDGPTTKPHIIASQAEQPEMIVTIEFKPAGLYAFTGIYQGELTDKSIPLDAASPELTKLVSHIVEKSTSVRELITSLDKFLLESIHVAYNPQLRQIFQNIFDNAGNTTIKKLSEDIHYSERQLNRIFKQYVGVNTKSFSRLIRINKTFQLMKKTNVNLTMVSDTVGFHDLSHFSRDFMLVCGITPQEYRNNMSDFYINPIKF